MHWRDEVLTLVDNNPNLDHSVVLLTHKGPCQQIVQTISSPHTTSIYRVAYNCLAFKKRKSAALERVGKPYRAKIEILVKKT